MLASAELEVPCIDVEPAPFDRAEIDPCVMAERAAASPVVLLKGCTPPGRIRNLSRAAHDHELGTLGMRAEGFVRNPIQRC